MYSVGQRGPHRNSQTTQGIAKTIDRSQQTEGKELLPQTIPKQLIERGERSSAGAYLEPLPPPPLNSVYGPRRHSTCYQRRILNTSLATNSSTMLTCLKDELIQLCYKAANHIWLDFKPTP